MDNTASASTSTSLPPVTDTPDAPLKKYAALSFKEKWQIFYKRSQYVNEKGLAKAEAENLARADFGVEALSDEEIQKFSEPGIVAKVVDNKAFQAVGLSALLHKKLDWVSAQATEKTEGVRGVVTEKVENTQTSVAGKIQNANTTTHDRVQELKEKTLAKAEEVKEKLFAKVPFLHHASVSESATKSEANVAPIAPTSVEANLKSIPEEQKVEPATSVNSAPIPSVSAPGVASEEKRETLAL